MDDSLWITTYLKRIRHHGSLEPTEHVLFDLQQCSLTHIPFDNMDIHMNRAVTVDNLDSIKDKILARGRGGYCYEQNQLFHELLLRLGFDAKLIRSRAMVDLKPGQSRPSTHAMILVTLKEKSFIVDVAGNSIGSPLPLFLEHETIQEMNGEKHRVLNRGNNKYSHEILDDSGSWIPLKDFSLDAEIDFQECAVMNWWTCTHPSSRHRASLIISVHGKDGFRMICNNCLIERQGGCKARRTIISSWKEFLQILADDFHVPIKDLQGLTVPNTDWPPLDGSMLLD
jgi:N-hydroxyarylamine O-acetyltransferase